MLLRLALVLFIVIAVLLLVQRGFLRGLDRSLDLTMIYAAAKAWLTGRDPYAFAPLYDLYLASGGTDKARDADQFTSLYPPTTYALLSPLGLLSWPAAKAAWLAFNGLLIGFCVAAMLLLRAPGLRRGSSLQLGLLGVTLVWAPLHTALSLGQLSVACTAAVLPIAVFAGRKPGTAVAVMAGSALGAAGALKPQLLFLLGPAILLTRWRAAGPIAIVAASVVAAVAIVRVSGSAPNWWDTWMQNVEAFTSSSIGRPDPANPQFHEMMHLETIVGLVLPAAEGSWRTLIATVLPVGIFVLAGSVLLVRHRLQPLPAEDARAWLALSAVLTVLTGYHRSYDATLLLVALVALAARAAARPSSIVTWLMGFAAAAFLVPAPSVFVAMTRRGLLPPALAEEPLWQATALQAHSWAALAWAALILRDLLSPPQWKSKPGRDDSLMVDRDPDGLLPESSPGGSPLGRLTRGAPGSRERRRPR